MRHPHPSRELRTARWSVSGYFFINGVAFSSWVARIPDVKRRLGLDELQLSLVLLVAAAGTVAGLAITGRIVDRWGAAAVSRVASLAVALCLPGSGWASGLASLVAAQLLFGLSGGAYNVAMNAQAVQVDRAYGRPVIASVHAMFSVGALVGSALGIAAVRLGLSPRAALTGVGLLLALGAVQCARARGALGAEDGDRGRTTSQTGPVLRDGRILLLGACAFACLLCEGAVADWSGVYLREHAGLGAAWAPAGYLLFSLAMTGGRLVSDRLVSRVGAMHLVTVGTLTAGGALAVGLLDGHGAGGLAGLTLFGLGLSCVTPQLFKAAGERTGHGTGSAVAAVASLAYLGLLGGPALLGLLSHAVGLRSALGLLSLLVCAVALAARRLRSPVPSRPGETVSIHAADGTMSP